MPVQRYRDVSEMPPPPRLDPKDPTTWRSIRELWAFSLRVLPPLYPPGVTRFRSHEEAQRDRDAAESARIQALRRERSSR
jgi:hypothetical protein